MTSLSAGDHLEEGDCRYLPKEILNDDYSHLSKADVFALGLIIYQAVSIPPSPSLLSYTTESIHAAVWFQATLKDLPKNGEEWHAIRSGNLPHMKGYSLILNEIVKVS